MLSAAGSDEDVQQRLQNAKKRYQADLLQQMQEREAAREAEKSRKRKEDEEERVRLNKEIERERVSHACRYKLRRECLTSCNKLFFCASPQPPGLLLVDMQLEKEEEEAKQLSKSKQLAAANVAAAWPLRQRRSLQATGCSSRCDIAQPDRQWPARSMLEGLEESGQPVQANTIQFAAENTRQHRAAAETEDHSVVRDKADQQPPLTGVQVERLLALGLEGLKAELKIQTEEMRFLQNQQRQVLQHMHYGTICQNVWNGHGLQRWPADPAQFASRPAALEADSMPMAGREPAEQRCFQDQPAIIRSLLKDAGVSDPEDLMRRLLESGAISLEYDATMPVAGPLQKFSSRGNPPTTEGTQTLGVPAACDRVHRCPSKQSLGIAAKSSCCSMRKFTGEVRQPIQNEGSCCREEAVLVESPEERPLPTLLKRQQQDAGLFARDLNIQQSRPQGQQEVLDGKNSPVPSAQNSAATSPEMELRCQRKEADLRQCRDVRQAPENKASGVPADRRWRLNELRACVTHGFPPPPPRMPSGRLRDAKGEVPWNITDSWCTSDCESELPCQTVPLSYTSGCSKLPVQQDLPKRCLARQIHTVLRDGWLPASQMECLEASTAQTVTTEEQMRPSKPQQDLYMELLARVEHGRAYEGIRVAQEHASRSAQKEEQSSQPVSEPHEAYRQPQPVPTITEMACDSGRILPDKASLCATADRRICRALSVNAAPLRLQQLHSLEDRIRQLYNTSGSPKERCLRQLEAASSHLHVQGSRHHTGSAPHPQERFKSRLSWEADTAFPIDEGARVQCHVTQTQVNTFGPRPFAPLLQPPLRSASQRGGHHNAKGNPDSSNPTPAQPPNKHALPLQQPGSVSTATTPNKRRSRLSRILGGMLLRSNSRSRP